ncbi:hypothetical protein KFL_006850030 [Klebsormidium nitens]|uniref:TsaA-like domain-containing protein n=1 Tax=Klebsormidium nitens TaxID=105231 RepID=A0A1Y1IMV6_KLENI|nr:hypothetical protein KFL_006850030 [Klebsormidium nitens]|eukprot:GAQ90789.1 hypothetical protein KFL_006850030 [Klebsormidium nitens]
MGAGSISSCDAGWVVAALSALFAVGQFLLLSKRTQQLQERLSKEEKERAAERAGRIRAQKELREKVVPAGTEGVSASYPFTPIGTLRSCFSTRNGTPRQPLLVPLSRARLTLTPGGVPAMALEGLAQYSHCWVLYVFHENTDLGRLWTDPDNKNFRAKVKVPRLNGGRLGVLATRSPHRPCPIGLSVAKIDRVDGPKLYLSGVDIVDGSPVLDVKPYLAYCDAVPGTSAPFWVEASGAADPLLLADVSFAAGVVEALDSLWEKVGKRSLYDSPEELLALVAQVLSRDIRSVHQRQSLHVATRPASAPGETRGGDKEVGLVTSDIRSVDQRQSPHVATRSGLSPGKIIGGDKVAGMEVGVSGEGAKVREDSGAGESFAEWREDSGIAAADWRTDSADGMGVNDAGCLQMGDGGQSEEGVRTEESSTSSEVDKSGIQSERECRQCLGMKPEVSGSGHAVTYHLKVEGVDFSYRVDLNGRVHVYRADLSS